LNSQSSVETQTASMRRSLVRNLVLLTLLTSGTILAVILFGAHRSVEGLSETLVGSTDDLTEARLQGFFAPVSGVLRSGRDWGEAGMLDLDDPRAVDALFIPVLAHIPQLSAVLIANGQGDSYVLMRKGEGWRSRLSRPDTWGGRSLWRVWEDAPAQAAEEWEEVGFDARTRPWFQGAMGQEDPTAAHWTPPYIFFTNKEPGITVATTYQAEDGGTMVIALDLTLTDISLFTTGLQVSEHGMALVLTEDGAVLGLPRSDRFTDTESIKQAVLSRPEALGIDVLADAVKRWRAMGRKHEPIFRFESGGERWWAGVRPFELDPARHVWIAAIVPEADFLAGVMRQRNQIMLITLAALAGAVLMAFIMARSFRRKVKKAVEAAKQYGQYTLQDKIGEGAMGAVYRAQHAMLRRPTAIKLLRPEKVSSPSAMGRFEREAQMTSRLTHPNTIAIFDYGRTSDSVFYYAMEYLVGVDLSTLVKATGPLPSARVVHVLTQVCGSLEEAHGVGLIHRDIKPANILLTERAGDPDFVKVVDFGLVKDLGSSEESDLTNVNTLTGTPLYLSPESITSPLTVGPQSDLYALGAVGYYLLVGEPVFRGETIVEVCAMHVRERPARPSERGVSGIPEDLEEAILACLEKDPKRRPQSAAALADMLARCVDFGKWGLAEARSWWDAHADDLPGGVPVRPRDKGSREAANVTVVLRSRAG